MSGNTELEPWELIEDEEDYDAEDLVDVDIITDLDDTEPLVAEVCDLAEAEEAADVTNVMMTRMASPHVTIPKPVPLPKFPLTRSQLMSRRRHGAFLEILAQTGRPMWAAQKVGYRNTSAVRRTYKTDPEFAKKYDEAIAASADVLENELIRRAVDGTVENIYHQGKVVGKKINFSDGLLQFALKGAKPEKYNPKNQGDIDVNVNVGIAVLPTTAGTDEEWESDGDVIDATAEVISDEVMGTSIER